jgi:hypothetical protein
MADGITAGGAIGATAGMTVGPISGITGEPGVPPNAVKTDTV